MRTDFLGLLATLNDARVPYVVVGGLALLLHGIDRVTADVDLVIDLATGGTLELVNALTTAGYRPVAPVDPTLFADATTRDQWRAERNMEVFSLWDSTNRRPTLDVLLSSPVPFADLHRDASTITLDGVPITVASIAHLIAMKQHTARPRDLDDVERLRALQRGEQK
ncbi:MAG: hypothetical protein FIB04_13985 [Gammaproteobacteria bacterium]|nr:hypothetical protein [Gammaproteobacteria bacterium]